MDLELRHLRVLCTVAESGSLSRAATALGMSQPGLTAQLQRIERMLGGRLFDRHRGGVRPTPLGEIVLTRARAVLPTIDDLLRNTALATGREPERERYRLGSVNAPLLSGMISALRSLCPAGEITARAESSPLRLVEHLAAGRLELVVVGDSPGYELARPPGVVVHAVATEPLSVLLPATHPLAVRPEVSLADLAGDDWALPEPDDDRTREYWTTAAGFSMRVPYEAEGRLILDLVRNGHAVSLCQATFDEVPGVVIRPITGRPLWYRHLIAWHEEGPLAQHAGTLAEFAARAYERAAARRRPARGDTPNP